MFDQQEFPGLPPRTALSPIETDEELAPAMSKILASLKPDEKVRVCLDLINNSGELCLQENPLRFVDARKRPANARRIAVPRNHFLKTMLYSLQTPS